MVESINNQVVYTAKVNAFYSGIGAKHGHMMIGNRGIEFFNERNLLDFIQIPWSEVKVVSAQVLFGGKLIRAFSIETQQNGSFPFTTKYSGKLLKEMRTYLSEKQLVQAPSLVERYRKKFF